MKNIEQLIISPNRSPKTTVRLRSTEHVQPAAHWAQSQSRLAWNPESVTTYMGLNIGAPKNGNVGKTIITSGILT